MWAPSPMFLHIGSASSPPQILSLTQRNWDFSRNRWASTLGSSIFGSTSLRSAVNTGETRCAQLFCRVHHVGFVGRDMRKMKRRVIDITVVCRGNKCIHYVVGKCYLNSNYVKPTFLFLFPEVHFESFRNSELHNHLHGTQCMYLLCQHKESNLKKPKDVSSAKHNDDAPRWMF